MRRSVLLFAIMASPLAAEEFRPITDPLEYDRLATAHVLVNIDDETERWTTLPDQTITAEFGGLKYKGAWSWRNGKVCYDGVLEAFGAIADCATVGFNGSEMELIFDQQPKARYTLEPT